MSERPCGQLERTCAEAYRKYQQAFLADTKPLERGKPPAKSATAQAEMISRGRRYHDLAAQLRACYEENKVPSTEERWPMP